MSGRQAAANRTVGMSVEYGSREMERWWVVRRESRDWRRRGEVAELVGAKSSYDAIAGTQNTRFLSDPLCLQLCCPRFWCVAAVKMYCQRTLGHSTTMFTNDVDAGPPTYRF